ncbi:MAG: DUF1573 domain-containing protein [Planctomycetaceae bacterium]|jgi:hypothetical protein|nr:DUF1573 domain-containing protein [Planctomycetaceae bacterium]
MSTKTYFAGLLFAFACGAFVFAADGGVAQDAAWADRLFSEKSHDFGSVPSGARAVYSFKVTNPYVETVHFTSATSSCSCTRATLVQPTVKTHETTELLVEFNTKGNSHNKSAQITLNIDQPFKAIVVLDIKGYIRPDIVFTPSQVTFGTAVEGEAMERTVEVTHFGRSNWRLINVVSNVGYLTGEIGDSKLSPRGDVTTTVKIRLNENAPRGRFCERLILQSNEQGRQSDIPLLVEGTIPGSLAATPPNVFLGFVKQGDESVRDVVLRSDKPFKITKLTSNNELITIELPTDPKPRSRFQIPVKLNVPADYNEKKIVAVINVETDDPNMKTEFSANAEIQE